MLVLIDSLYFRFFTQSKPMQKSDFFEMLGDHQMDATAPSLPPGTNEEEDQMNDKDISRHLSFGLDSVLKRAEAKSLSEADLGNEQGNSSPYGSFRSKFSMFKSGFDKAALNSSEKSRNQFKPVKAKQAKLDQFQSSPKVQRKPIPNTNFFDDEDSSKVERRPPSLPPDTHEEDDQMEDKSLSVSQLSLKATTEDPALPSLSQRSNLYSIDNDSFSLSELSDSYSVASQSLPISSSPEGTSVKSDIDSSQHVDSSRNTTPSKHRAIKKSNSIISMFRRTQNKDKRNPLYGANKAESPALETEHSEDGETVTLTESSKNTSASTVITEFSLFFFFRGFVLKKIVVDVFVVVGDGVECRCRSNGFNLILVPQVVLLNFYFQGDYTETPSSEAAKRLGPCRRFGLSKSTSSHRKKKSSPSIQDKKKQPKLTESLSIYFFNK